MRPKHKTYTIAAADADGICEAQTLAGAGDLTLDGALVTDGVGVLAIPRHISITPAADESGITFTVTGTDRYGAALTEDVTGGNATLTKTTKCFQTVTGVSVDGALAGNVTVGSANSLETAWVPLDHRCSFDCGGRISTGGAMNFQIERTVGDVFSEDEWDLPINSSIFAVTATAIRAKITDHVSGNFILDIITRGK